MVVNIAHQAREPDQVFPDTVEHEGQPMVTRSIETPGYSTPHEAPSAAYQSPMEATDNNTLRGAVACEQNQIMIPKNGHSGGCIGPEFLSEVEGPSSVDIINSFESVIPAGELPAATGCPDHSRLNGSICNVDVMSHDAPSMQREYMAAAQSPTKLGQEGIGGLSPHRNIQLQPLDCEKIMKKPDVNELSDGINAVKVGTQGELQSAEEDAQCDEMRKPAEVHENNCSVPAELGDNVGFKSTSLYADLVQVQIKNNESSPECATEILIDCSGDDVRHCCNQDSDLEKRNRGESNINGADDSSTETVKTKKVRTHSTLSRIIKSIAPMWVSNEFVSESSAATAAVPSEPAANLAESIDINSVDADVANGGLEIRGRGEFSPVAYPACTEEIAKGVFVTRMSASPGVDVVGPSSPAVVRYSEAHVSHSFGEDKPDGTDGRVSERVVNPSCFLNMAARQCNRIDSGGFLITPLGTRVAANAFPAVTENNDSQCDICNTFSYDPQDDAHTLQYVETLLPEKHKVSWSIQDFLSFRFAAKAADIPPLRSSRIGSAGIVALLHPAHHGKKVIVEFLIPKSLKCRKATITIDLAVVGHKMSPAFEYRKAVETGPHKSQNSIRIVLSERKLFRGHVYRHLLTGTTMTINMCVTVLDHHSAAFTGFNIPHETDHESNDSLLREIRAFSESAPDQMIKVTCNYKNFECSKFLLQTRGPRFRSLITRKTQSIELADITAHSAEEMLTFIETNKCRYLTDPATKDEELLELITAAHAYDVSALFDRTASLLISRLSNINVLLIQDVASSFSPDNHLALACSQYLDQLPGSIVASMIRNHSPHGKV